MNSISSRTFWVSLAVVFGVTLYVTSSVLAPFLIGVAIAYMLDPLCERLDRIGVPRWAAAGAVLFGFFSTLTAVSYFLIPFVWGQLVDLVKHLPEIRTALMSYLQPALDAGKPHISPMVIERVQEIANISTGTIVSGANKIVKGAVSGGLAVMDVSVIFVLSPIVGFYLLKDWPELSSFITDSLPRAYEKKILALARAIDQTLAAWLRGQMVLCLVLACFYMVALTLSGLKFSLLIGLLTGLCAFIPFVGFAIGLTAALVAAAFSFDTWTGWACVGFIFAIGQMFESYVLTPRLIGQSVGLHEVWVMFALMAGGAVLGFTGVLLAVPTAAILRVLLKSAYGSYLESDYYTK
ncbi:AI-2E family transporter [Thalassospira xiamenensis]|uniref:Predicted PurR-regulated permease PerM n=1 Tax=Thalassospira xiamenensis TaxID=220697 RepID=A0A285TXG9_9PROT|nr:AI-2E family transporter [Thalassospira xiamenensis]SOC30467.1 Predicted PurR-regulated permease PerM [Thalassospira xiamenensis]